MTARSTEIPIVLVVVIVVASGLAGATLSAQATQTTADERTYEQADASTHEQIDGSGQEQGYASAQDEGIADEAELECAASPPDDGSDPDSDEIGWENGYWYDESLDVDQSDGVQEDEREAIVARTTARVEAIRCIEFEESVPVSVISRAEFREQELERAVDDELRTFDNAKFEALFLVNESADSIQVQRENRGTGVLGFYSPEQSEIVVIAESEESLRIDEITLAHELVHAWQDQQFDIDSGKFDVQRRDETNARNGLVEGDASYVDSLYQRQCGAEWECLEGRESTPGQLSNIGVYVLKFQPYSDGPAFIRLARNVGGWDAVNALYENLPASSEQVIHPERYRADPPTNVTLDDATSDEWERVRPPDRPDYARVGEASLLSMFVFPYYDSGGQTEIVQPAQWFNQNETGNISDFNPLNYESPYSTGWDGDRLHVYRNESGELAYVWKLAWDSPQDTQQFAEGYREVLRYWGAEEVGPGTWRIEDGGFADAFHVNVSETTVTITNAPSVEQLSEVRSDVQPIEADVSEQNDVAEPRATVAEPRA
jgi:type II secretory pathway pseudopilin PulG